MAALLRAKARWRINILPRLKRGVSRHENGGVVS